MKTLNFNKKKLYLYFIFLSIASLIFRLYSYEIFPPKYFYDFNKILKLSLGETLLTDKSFSFTANTYKYINFLQLTTLQEWAVFLFIGLQVVLILFLKKIKIKKVNILEILTLSIGYLFFSLYVLNISKEYIQFIVFNICYFVIIKNKSQLYIIIIMLLMAYYFRTYLIIVLGLYLLLNKIGFGWLKKKKKMFLLIIGSIVLLCLLKIFFQDIYITLITIRYNTNKGRIGSLDAQSMIFDTFKNKELNPIIYFINFITMVFRLMFPIELVRKIKYLPYVYFQCHINYIIVKKIFEIKKRKSKIINFIISFLSSFIDIRT